MKADSLGLSGGEFRANPHRVFAKIQDRENPDLRQSLVVVDAEGKPARKHPMKPEVRRVNSMKEAEALQIGKKRVHEIVAKSKVLGMIGGPGEVEIIRGVREDDDGLQVLDEFSRERRSETERNLL